MDFIALFLFPHLALAAIAIAAIKSGWVNKLKIFAAIFGIPFLIFFFDELVGQAALYAACTIDGGTTVKRAVISDGYFAEYDRVVFEGCSGDCISALTKHKFKYYEVEVKNKGAYFTDEIGVHKFFLDRNDSSNCSPKKSKIGAWKDIPENMCVAYTVSPTPTSRYSITGGVRDRYNQSAKIGFWPVNLQKNQTLVKDIKTGEVVGSVTTFWYWGGWVRNSSIGHNGASNCEAYPLSHSDVFTKLIRPE